MVDRPKPQIDAWYFCHHSNDYNTLAKGFGISIEKFDRLRSQIYAKAAQIELPDVNYDEDYMKAIQVHYKNGETIYQEFKHKLAPVPIPWRREAMRHLLVQARMEMNMRPGASTREHHEVPSASLDPQVDANVRAGINVEPSVDNEPATKNEQGANSKSSFETQTITGESPDLEENSQSRQRVIALSPSFELPDHMLDRIHHPSPVSFSGESSLPVPTASANMPQSETRPSASALSSAVDPVKTPLKLYLHVMDQATNSEEQVGAFSTRFLCSPSSSPPTVSFDLLVQAVKAYPQCTSTQPAFLLNNWSNSNLAIREEAMLNTAIYEILEQGCKTAILRVVPRPSVGTASKKRPAPKSSDGETSTDDEWLSLASRTRARHASTRGTRSYRHQRQCRVSTVLHYHT